MTPVAAVEPGPGCEIVSERTELDGDVVRTEVTARSDGTCARLRFPLPGGAGTERPGAVERRHDGTRVKLDDTRWSIAPRGPDGSTTATLHVPDLWSKDEVRVVMERTHVAADVAAAWVAGRAPPLPPPPAPAVVTHRSRVLRLVVPPGNLQVALHPDGPASSHVDDTWTVAAGDEDRALVPELPPQVTPTLRAEPPGSAELRATGGVWTVWLPASEAPARVTLSYDDPASPTHGERGELDELTVLLDHGTFRWDADRWALVAYDGDAVLPAREALLVGLDRRFKALALPEPGIPLELRHAPPTDDTLAQLRPVLATRAPTLPDLGRDPLFARPLAKARSSGALTPTEAMLVTWLYARQLRFDAWWAFARPAPTETLPVEAPDPLSPAGYDLPLVLVHTEGGDRWIDPTCGVCGPFELRPSLQGARVLSPGGVTRTPDPVRGALTVDVAADTITVDAEGPAALLLRESLADVPAGDRAAALATALGGPGAQLRSLTGLDTGGAPVHVVLARGDGLVPDPTALPVPGADGAWWFDWIGERTMVTDGPAVPGEHALPGITDRITDRGGRAAHTLEVTERRIPADPGALRPVSPPPPDPDPPSPPSAPSSP